MNVFSPVMYYNSNMIATIILNVESSDGYAMDPPESPVVKGVFKPDLVAMDGFPQNMTRLGILTGAFISQFQLPAGLSSIGTYIVVVSYVDPSTKYERQVLYSLIVGVPFGNNSVVGV